MWGRYVCVCQCDVGENKVEKGMGEAAPSTGMGMGQAVSRTHNGNGKQVGGGDAISRSAICGANVLVKCIVG